jgi:hypothetical protein
MRSRPPVAPGYGSRATTFQLCPHAPRRPELSVGLLANFAGTTGLAPGLTVTEELTKAG